MRASSAIFGERFPWQVAAVFEDEERARGAAETLQSEENLRPEQVRIYRPEEAGAPGKLNPRRQNHGIAGTLVKSHLTLGVAGALAAFLLAMLLLWSGFQAFVASPAIATAAVTFLGLIAGLLLGGLVSLRPDQDVLRFRLEEAMASEHGWAVVVRARTHGEETRAAQRLQERDGKVISAA